MKNMVKIILGAILFVIVTSCSSDQVIVEREDLTVFPQTWQLERVITSLNPELMEGDEMPFQEGYFLYENGRFKKVRVKEGIEKEAAGTFDYQTRKDAIYLVLQYVDQDSIIENCIRNRTETLRLDKSSNILFSTTQYCDGPTLEYTLR